MQPNGLKITLIILLALLASFTALIFGSVNIDWLNWFQHPNNDKAHLDQLLVLGIRLPRVINAFITGGSLGLAGVFMQVLLANPLADPYVLGISGGASFCVLLAMLFGISVLHLPVFAVLGACLSTALVFGLSRNHHSLLLTGIIIASAWGALIQLLLVLFPQHALPGAIYWLLGELPQRAIAWPSFILLIIGFMIGIRLTVSLNLLARGEQYALTLGLDSRRLQRQLLLLSAILTASAVSIAGNIGFIGLVVPHLLRLSFSADHKYLVPLSVVAGGTLLVLADLLSRSLVAPQHIPVGIFTALIGLPLFIYLLRKTNG